MPTAAQIAEAILTPSLPLLLIGLLILIGAPILLHTILAASSTYTTPPTILLLGPSHAGKTSLLTLLERGGTETPDTHTSQVSHSVELEATTDVSSTKGSFRNQGDASGGSAGGTYTKFLLVDTPGHGKLRNVAMGKLGRVDKLRGVVFMVDAAALGERDRERDGSLASTAAYLYDVLLYLQQRQTSQKDKSKGKGKGAVPVLVAANKMDLFTALPANLVKMQLERELSSIRATRSKGLLDSGVGDDEVGTEDQDSWLGEYGSEKFSFGQMMEFDVEVEVVGGSVRAEEADVDGWWSWMLNRV
ncbi:hypothetical protein E4U13_007600 [Claviceps humidiphila]|uniref:Signal recognition particle receptor subunit beta n=1 Tax=Claviceps humidiphila TaxID=1294629 RepID=A0A9P7TWE7_9HYPO|nr:hypothetical protein E4U13_007600 [Claviceps humidiphila]